MTAVEKPTKPERKVTVKPGDTVVCIKSHSPGYKVGKEYKVHRNADGLKILKADDGFDDLWSMLVSKFKLKEKNDVA